MLPPPVVSGARGLADSRGSDAVGLETTGVARGQARALRKDTLAS
jgi:hypothetical protein